MSEPTVRYSVYRRGTDEPVIIHGTAKQCARAMHIQVDSFRTMLDKQRNGKPGGSMKWEIYRDDEEGLDDGEN